MTRQQPYVGLEFSYQQLLANLQDISAIARSFITPNSLKVLSQCASDLQNIRNSTANKVHYWTIRQNWPVQTLESSGEYRASEKGTGRSVFAEFSFRWGVKNSAANGNSRTFVLVDEATTSIRVIDTHTTSVVALWQMEVGDATSPGCHFHASMTERNYKTGEPAATGTLLTPAGDIGSEANCTGDGSGDSLFPEWLKVPRLPSIIVTPFDALEFLLCELFQNGWPQAVSESNHNVQSWSRSQNDRLSKLLRWKLDVLRNSTSGPWPALKRAKPDARLFIGN